MVLVALAIMAACWAWAGRIMRLPLEERVLATVTGGPHGRGGR
jgi:hypothetical protein